MAGTPDVIDRLLANSRAVYLLLAVYFLLNIVVRLSLPQSPELDEGQQLFLAQWLAPGYDSQPPFYNWLQYGVVRLFGETIFSLAVLKNTLLFCCYLLFGMAASLLLRDRRLAAIATLGLLTIPQISFEAQRDLSHTVAVLFAACLFLYGFLKTLKQPTAMNYALTGVAIGIGLLSKYNFVLLPLAALVALLPEREHRARLLNPQLLLTIAISAVIVSPHGLWFVEHVDLATQRTLGKLTEAGEPSRLLTILEGLAALSGAIAAFFLPTVLIFWIAFGRRLTASWNAASASTRLIGRIMAILVIALIALVVFGGATAIKPRWLVPFFFLLPLYLCLKIEASGQEISPAPRRFGIIALIVMLIVPLVLFARVPVLGEMGRYEKLNVPYGPAIAAIVATGAHPPSIIAAGDLQIAGAIRLHAPGIAVTVSGYERFEHPYRFDATHPVLMIWRRKGVANPAMPDDLAAWLRNQPGMAGIEADVQDISFPYHFGAAGDLYHFGYAWFYPAAK